MDYFVQKLKNCIIKITNWNSKGIRHDFDWVQTKFRWKLFRLLLSEMGNNDLIM